MSKTQKAIELHEGGMSVAEAARVAGLKTTNTVWTALKIKEKKKLGVCVKCGQPIGAVEMERAQLVMMLEDAVSKSTNEVMKLSYQSIIGTILKRNENINSRA